MKIELGNNKTHLERIYIAHDITEKYEKLATELSSWRKFIQFLTSSHINYEAFERLLAEFIVNK